jgi:O-antigen biosynthesis protein WbqP
MKRAFDLFFCLVSMILLLVPFVLIFIAIKVTSHGPIIYWSDRVGRGNNIFHMPKFRTMQINTPEVPTHLFDNPNDYLTPIGSFLRKSSLDELPQLWSILKGDMSLVGPRPALFNQDDLVKLRTLKGVDQLTPGLTGWAQINGRDELPILIKVKFDEEYLRKKSFLFDLKILWLTVIKLIMREGISH